MKLTHSFTVITATSAIGLLLGVAACSGSNDPARQGPSTGGTPATGGAAETGGSTATGGATATGGTAATGGAAVTGGATAGGAAATGGTPSTCTDDLGPDNSLDFSPKCALTLTAAGEEPKKDVACTAADVQVCYRTCGPQSTGFKTETCTAGVYVEGDCAFPTGIDYSCYGVPTVIDAATCPATTPQASQPCDVPACTLCNLADGYLDSGGAAKIGYCVCQQPNAAGTRTWSCSSASAWPCPLGACCG